MTERARLAVVVFAVGALGAASIGAQQLRDRWYERPQTDARMLYLRSGAVASRLALSFDALAADLYWLRVIQHYGGDRLSDRRERRYELLYPLLDLTTTLDPHFQIAYRFGAVFLAEEPPGGPGRLDLAEQLLRKGLAQDPANWRYAQDLGFLNYWYAQDFDAAADWFQRASEMPDAPNWLAPLAASMLVRGDRRDASRQLLTRIFEDADQPWLRQVAERYLRQLDALDQMDQLDARIARFREMNGALPASWIDLVRAGWLPGIPVDPAGTPYVLNPTWGTVQLSPDSPLGPLPQEIAR